MAVTVGTLLVELRAKTDAFMKGMGDARKYSFDSASGISSSIASISQAFDKLKFDNLKNLEKSLKTVGGIAAGVGVGIATALVAGMTAAAVSTSKQAAEMNKLAQSYGLSLEFISSLRVASKLTDVELETLTIGFGRLAKASYGAASSGKDTIGGFLKVTDGAGKLRDMQSLVLDVAEKFSRLEDGTGKTALAMQLFGKSGAALIPFLNQGRDGVKELMQMSERLGLTWSEKDAVAADRFKTQVELLELKSLAFKEQLSRGVLPALNNLSDAMLTVDQNGNSVAKGFGETMGTALVWIAKAAYSAGIGLDIMYLKLEQLANSKALRGATRMTAEKLFGPLANLIPEGGTGRSTEEITNQIEKLLQEKERFFDELNKVATSGESSKGKGSATVDRTEQDKALEAAKQTMLGIAKEIAQGEDNVLGAIELKYKQLAAKVREIFSKFPALRKEFADIEIGIVKAKNQEIVNAEIDLLQKSDEAVAKAVSKTGEKFKNPFPDVNRATPMPVFGAVDPFKRYNDSLNRAGQTAEETQQRIAEMGRAAAEIWTNMQDPVERYREQIARIGALMHPPNGEAPYLPEKEGLKASQAAWDEMSRSIEEAMMRTQKFSSGAQVALKQYADYAKDAAAQAYEAISNGLRNLDNSIRDFFRNGKFDLAGMLKDSFADAMTGMFKHFVTGPIMGSIGKALGIPDLGQRPDGTKSRPLHVVISNPAAAVAGAASGGILEGVGGYVKKLFGFANGGVMTSIGPMRLERFAGGGISSHPAIFGEGTLPEAAVPLPDGRNIPVKLLGDGGGPVNYFDFRGADAETEKRLRSEMARVGILAKEGAKREMHESSLRRA